MIDLLQCAQDAAFSMLLPLEQDADLTAILGAPVRVLQHVPENTQPPMIIIGDLDTSNEGGKDDQLENVGVQIQFVYRGPGRAPLLTMMSRGRDLLHKQRVTVEGSLLAWTWVRGSASSAATDGITYAGISEFDVFAQPAD